MNAREAAYYILLNFESPKHRLDDLIYAQFSKGSMNAKDRKMAYNLSSGVVRNLSLFDWKLGALYKGNYKKALNKFKVILRLALYEIDFLDFIPNFATVNEYVNLAKTKLGKREVAVVNGILRTYLRERGKYNPEKKFKFVDTQISVKYSFPEWLVKRWIEIWGAEETRQLCESFNSRPDFDIRVNLKNISSDEFQKILTKNNIHYIQSNFFNEIVKVTDLQKIMGLKLFAKGLCSIQDESALLVKELLDLQEGDTVMDACAAPGGKFTAILEGNVKIKNLTGLEIYRDRLLKIKENCDRLNLGNYFLIQGDSTKPPFGQKFNKILIDAPCSGFGTLRKNPDIKWRRSMGEIIEFSHLQHRLLESLSKYVKPGGMIVYSTCTIDPLENENVISTFLETNKKQFRMVKPDNKFSKYIDKNNFIRTFPHKHSMDGSFAAILKKVDDKF